MSVKARRMKMKVNQLLFVEEEGIYKPVTVKNVGISSRGISGYVEGVGRVELLPKFITTWRRVKEEK